MAAWLALGQSNATATTDVTVNYRATVTSVNDPSGVLGGVEIDDTITGTYSYDADARDLISSPARAVYRFDPASYGWTFDAPSGEIRSDSGLKRNYRIVIRNQSSDVYDALFSINRSPPGSGLRLNTANIKLRDNTGTAFSSDTLSATPPDPANFSSSRLFLNGCVVDGTICAQNQNGVSTFFSVVAKVTALSAGGDTTPPTVTAPTPILVECATIGGTPASNQAIQDWLSSASAVDDVDGSIPVTNDVTVGSCALGVTKTVTFTAADGAGNTSTATSTITVVDTAAPSINDVSASPDTLWPANHKMRQVTVTVDVSDICDANATCKIVSVTSDEPVNETSPDWEITGDLTLELRAERSGNGDGRIYTITVECADSSGNKSNSAVEVAVPHDKGKK